MALACAGYPHYAPPVSHLHTVAVPKAAVYAAPAPVAIKHIEHDSYDPNPQYSYGYGVSDPHTGDSKTAQETLVNGVVEGSYTIAEPDGTIRKVTYTADKIHGFNAVVEKLGHPKVAYAAAPVKTVYGGYHH